MKPFNIILVLIFVLVIITSCTNVTKPVTPVTLPSGCYMQPHFDNNGNMSITLSDSLSESIGYQIISSNGIYFQSRYLLYHTYNITSIIDNGSADGCTDNPKLLHINPPIDTWLKLNFVIYNENFPSYYSIGHWAYNPDFWSELAICPVGSYTKYEYWIKFSENGRFTLKND